MTDTLDQVASALDPDQALDAVGLLSLVLGGAAVLAPARTAGLLGLKGAAGGHAPQLVRMVGVRNAVMGLRTLQASGDDRARALQAGLAVGAVDAAAVLLAARRGSITPRAAASMLLLLGLIAGAGVVASRQ